MNRLLAWCADYFSSVAMLLNHYLFEYPLNGYVSFDITAPLAILGFIAAAGGYAALLRSGLGRVKKAIPALLAFAFMLLIASVGYGWYLKTNKKIMDYGFYLPLFFKQANWLEKIVCPHFFELTLAANILLYAAGVGAAIAKLSGLGERFGRRRNADK